jgi:hypothetical protein
MEETSSKYEYIEKEVADSRQWVVLQLGVWARDYNSCP